MSSTRLLLVHSIAALVLAVLAVTAVAGAFSDWERKLDLTFSEAPGALLTNFPVLIRFSDAIEGFDYAEFDDPEQASDLRFSDPVGNELVYEVETWDTNGVSSVWLRMPELQGTGEVVTAYWRRAGVDAPVYRTNGTVWAADFDGVWHLQQTNSGARAGDAIFGDASANARHGLDYVTDTGKQGIVAGGQSFGITEANDYIHITPSGVRALTNTLSFWFNNRQSAAARAILSVGNSAGDSVPYLIVLHGSGVALLQIYSGGGYVTVTNSSQTNRWYHMAIRREGALVSVLLDGQQIWSGSRGTGGNRGAIWLGSGYTGYYRGLLDEVRLSTEARSAEWLRAEWLNVVSNGVFIDYGWVHGYADLTVQSLDAIDLGPDQGRARGRVLSDGGAENPLITLCWGESDAKTNSVAAWTNAVVLGNTWSVGEAFDHLLTNLTLGVTYHYRFHASNTTGQAWSDPRAFVTVTEPVLVNPGATTVRRRTAVLQVEIVDTGGADPTSSGFVWWPVGGSPTTQVATGSQTGLFTTALTDLTPGMTYRYTAWASNLFGIGWSPEAQFTLASADPRDWYVATNGLHGDADRWSNAFTDMASVLQELWHGDTVRLAGHRLYLDAEWIWPAVSNLTLIGGYAAIDDTSLPGRRDPARWPTDLAPAPGMQDRLLRIQSRRNPSLDGITLRDAFPVDPYGGNIWGGALYATHVTNLVLRDCRLINNQGRQRGGAVYALQTSALVTNSVFWNNVARSGSDQWAYGGAFFIEGGAWTFADCEFEGNRGAGASSLGAALYINGGTHALRNALLANNLASGSFTVQGGGMYVVGVAMLSIDNATIAGNTPHGYYGTSGNVTLRNSILSYNFIDIAGPSPALIHCLVGDGTGEAGSGKLTGDPRFELPLYYLMPDSPCLDAGDRTVEDAGVAGRTSLTNGMADSGIVNFGYHFERGLDVDLTLYVDPVEGNDGNSGDNPADALRSITRGLALAREHELAEPRVRIYLAAGMYTNGVETFPLAVSGHTVQLLGAGPDTTVIDATNANTRVFELLESWGDNRFENITLRGGNREGDVGGGAVFISDSTLTLQAVDLRSNRATRLGGALYAIRAAGVMRDVRIEDNTAARAGDGWAYGGGMFLTHGTWLADGVVLAGNRATATSAQGGAAYLTLGSYTFRNILVADNQVVGSRTLNGSAFYTDGRGRLFLENATIVTNRGAAAIHRHGGTIEIWNSILWDHPAGDDVGLTAADFHYSCAAGLTAGEQGNITNNPVFVNPATGDFRLSTPVSRWSVFIDDWVAGGGTSPALDAGSNRYWMAEASDLDRLPRLAPAFRWIDRTPQVDMGVFEAHTRLTGSVISIR